MYAVTSVPSRRIIISPSALLAALPVFDALINQLATIQISIGSFSLFQAARGAELLFLVLLYAWTLSLHSRLPISLARFTIGFGLALIFILISEIRRYGSLDSGSIVGSFQLLYVLILFLTAATVIRTPRSGTRVLIGIGIGALITATSILIAFFRKDNITDVYGGITATSGYFFSAKSLVGGLTIGGLIWTYLSSRTARLAGLLATGICFLALYCTYNRTGQLCLAASMLWLAYWWIRHGRGRPDAFWVPRLLTLLLLATFIFIAYTGTSDLAKRWSDLGDQDTAGSGRLLMWAVSINWILQAPVADLLTGTGFRGMFDIIESGAGIRVHTHSDIFDLLLMGGIVGLFMYGLIVMTFKGLTSTPHKGNPAHAIAVCAFLTLLISSILTGQFTQPSAMTVYILALAAAAPLHRSPIHNISGIQ